MIFRRVWPQRPSFAGPFAGLDQLRREMLRLFDSHEDGVPEAGAGVFPPLNVSQDDDAFYVRAEVPGIKAGELSITALANRLTIAGNRSIPVEDGNVSYHRRERAEGAFRRTLTLPTDIDMEKSEARCTDGVLTLRLPKAERAKPRQIAVKG